MLWDLGFLLFSWVSGFCFIEGLGETTGLAVQAWKLRGVPRP